ncbi:MAG TPA: FHA domain-containing protein [Bryobacteraceae bacterium]|nr:FHA domain-containing protein [Bryobacteraceae bacterium]
MTRIIIRHLTGARANQFDEFPVSAAKELIVGRDLTANVRVDPDRDDLVSRQHVKITCQSDDADDIQLIDLQSRNGTFLNRQRIYGAVHLSHNDVVQLGAGGPEFRFELDPPPLPVGGARPTREATFDQGFGAKPTREWSPAGAGPEGAAPSRPVGRATVERMLGEQFSKVKGESNKAVWIGVVGLLAILAIGLGGWFYLRQTRTEQIADLERSLAAQQRQAVELRKKSDQASVKELEKIDQDIQKQVAALRELKAKEDARRAAEENRAARAAAQPAVTAAPAPQAAPPVNPLAAAAAAAGVDPNSSYDSLIDQATDRFQHGKTKEALDVVKVAIAKDSNRWEGYEFAGQLAERLGDYTTANGMFEDALKWAPAENRQDIQFKLNALKEKLATR